jgi:hypothetical protein
MQIFSEITCHRTWPDLHPGFPRGRLGLVAILWQLSHTKEYKSERAIDKPVTVSTVSVQEII